MWKSPGKYGRVDMYAKKQHLVLTFVVKSNGAPVSERLKLRH